LRENIEYLPLKSTKVIDLTDIKGAYCSKLLADMGCEVIKIEPPSGDTSRLLAPFAHDDPNPEKSLVFSFYSSNKKSITLNIASAEGKRILKKLIKTSDVLVESYSPGYLDSIGLSYQSICKINPELVMSSISPFGQDGPKKHYQGTELTLLASGGFTYECGVGDEVPCTDPGYMAYDLAGTDAAAGIALALFHKDLMGQGQYIDIAIQQSVAFHTFFGVPQWMNDGIYRRRYGAVAINYWPGDIFKTKDEKYILLMCFVPGQFKTVAEWVGSDALADPMWQDAKQRQDNTDFLRAEIQGLVSQYDQNDFVEEAQRRHLPATPVNNIADYIEDPQTVFREAFTVTNHPSIGKHLLPNTPAVLGWGRKQKPKPAPSLGQHNGQIYQELGLSKNDVLTLKRSGVI